VIGQNIGKYRVLDRIGKGGMGTVYRAVDEMLHRDVAIKVLNAELNDPEVAKRFRAEAITVARLSHPGIATIYELFEHQGEWLMVMEFVRGETLENMVTRMGPLSAQRSAELCMQALAALAHAHSMGVVHRDLKPANLMITENGSVKVMDFGIARVSGSEHLTNAGFMMGTPAYMAPEQVRGGDVDSRADLYAMGVVFYRLSTAKLPFKGDTAFAMVQSQVNEPPTPVGLVRADLPPWVEEVVTRALAKSPEHRFQSAAEFHEAFARCLAGLPLSSMYAIGETTMTPSRLPSGAFPSRPTASASFPMPTGSQPAVQGPITNPGTYGASSAGIGSTDPTIAAPSGASLRPAPPSTGAQAPAAPPAASAVIQKKIPVLWIGLGAAGVVAAVVAAVMMMGGGGQTPEPTPTPTAVVESTPSPTPDPATTAAIDPAAASIAPGQLARGTAPPATATPLPTTSPTPGRGAAAMPTPTATTTPSAAVPPVGRGAMTPVAPEADALVTFTDVKLLEVSGKRGTDRDVVLNFGGGQVMVMPRSGGAAIAALTYKRITRATYVRARDPKWDPNLAAPAEGLDVGGFMRTSRHWLVLQGVDHFEILRLEDSNFRRVIEAVEARTGIKVDRPAGEK